MDRRTRPASLALVAALICGVSYLAADHLPVARDAGLLWKGSGVGFLALYAALSARDTDGWLLALVMAVGATGTCFRRRWALPPEGPCSSRATSSPSPSI